MSRYGLQSNTARTYDDLYDRSDATTYYGGLFSDHRAGSYLYGERYSPSQTKGWRSYEARSYDEPFDEERYVGERFNSGMATETGAPESESGRAVRKGRYALSPGLRISSSEKGIMIFVAVVIALIFVGLVTLEAYSVSIQHEINKMDSDSALLQEEINDLMIAIEDKSNIGIVQKVAEKDLKMKYPSQNQRKYLEEGERKGENPVTANGEADIAGTSGKWADSGEGTGADADT